MDSTLPDDSPVKDPSRHHLIAAHFSPWNGGILRKVLVYRSLKTKRFLGWRTYAEWLVLYAVHPVTSLGKRSPIPYLFQQEVEQQGRTGLIT
jgi:hypothetical protein